MDVRIVFVVETERMRKYSRLSASATTITAHVFRCEPTNIHCNIGTYVAKMLHGRSVSRIHDDVEGTDAPAHGGKH